MVTWCEKACIFMCYECTCVRTCVCTCVPQLILEIDQNVVNGTSVFVISPYKQQVSFQPVSVSSQFIQFPSSFYLLPFVVQIELLKRVFGDKKTNNISLYFYTVDSVQGKECDITLLSSVRSKPIGEFNLEFVNNKNRLNVSLSRSKFGLIVVGNCSTLADKEPSDDNVWMRLIEVCESECVVCQCFVLYAGPVFIHKIPMFPFAACAEKTIHKLTGSGDRDDNQRKSGTFLVMAQFFFNGVCIVVAFVFFLADRRSAVRSSLQHSPLGSLQQAAAV